MNDQHSTGGVNACPHCDHPAHTGRRCFQAFIENAGDDLHHRPEVVELCRCGPADVKAVLTETIAVHKPTTKRINHPRRQGLLLNIPACSGCDWAVEDGDHDAHVAEVLAALPGVAVIQLPEPDRAWAKWDAWTVDEDYVVAAATSAVYLEDEESVTALPVETAKRLSDCLAAAADAVLSEETTK